MMAEAGVSTDALLLAGVSIATVKLAEEIETVADMDCILTVLDGGASSVTNWSPS